MIAYMDRDIGRIMARLKELNIDENTVVMFTSDNGPHKEGGSDPAFHDCNGPLRGIKRDLYDGGIRVPLIVRWPTRISAVRRAIIFRTIGIFSQRSPTLRSLNYKQRSTVSRSLRHCWDVTRNNVQHDFLYWEFHERGFQQAARMGKWKGVLTRYGGKLELYDLENDIGEENDISEQHPEIVTKLEAYLKTARTREPEWPIRPDPPAKAKAKGKAKGKQKAGKSA